MTYKKVATYMIAAVLGSASMAQQEPAGLTSQTSESRDREGRLVERVETDAWIEDTTFDSQGRVLHVKRVHPKGRTDLEHYLYTPDTSAAAQGPSMIPTAVGWNITDEQFRLFIERLPPSAFASVELVPWNEEGTRAFPAGYHSRELGKDWQRSRFEFLGRSMQVTTAVEGGDVRISDDWGATRVDRYWETASLSGCDDCLTTLAVFSEDRFGRIAQVVTDSRGYPLETRFGETLVARYHYPQLTAPDSMASGGDEGLWLELVDARTGRQLLDSRQLEDTGIPPSFRTQFVQSYGAEVFAAVQNYDWTRNVEELYALIPLDNAGQVWRSITAGATESPNLQARVDYTHDRLRVHIFLDMAALIVEGPRRGNGPITIAHPAGLSLPDLPDLPEAEPLGAGCVDSADGSTSSGGRRPSGNG